MLLRYSTCRYCSHLVLFSAELEMRTFFQLYGTQKSESIFSDFSFVLVIIIRIMVPFYQGFRAKWRMKLRWYPREMASKELPVSASAASASAAAEFYCCQSASLCLYPTTRVIWCWDAHTVAMVKILICIAAKERRWSSLCSCLVM